MSLMLRLRMLGGLSIEQVAVEQPHSQSRSPRDASPALVGAAVQRRPLALLALLAMAGEHGLSRDEVLVHLWPDNTPARARNVLKQTLYSLRRDLRAPDLVLARGDHLRLNAIRLTSDVAELEAALDQGDVERALELYHGPFLDGFSLPDVPEFERWVRAERLRLTECVEAVRQRPRAESPKLERAATTSSGPRRRLQWRFRFGIAALVALTSFAALQMVQRVRDSASVRVPVDPSKLAVLPFDVAAADTALRFLARGMVELLAVRLTSERDGGVRTVAPRVALSAWEDRDGTATRRQRCVSPSSSGPVA